jgi:uncharacterized membrane protein
MSYSYKLEPVSLKEDRKQKYDIYSFFVLSLILYGVNLINLAFAILSTLFVVYFIQYILFCKDKRRFFKPPTKKLN